MRELTWDGGRNLRDLGGLPTPLSPTKTTMWRRVARGPRREVLTQRGWADAATWGLTSIIDLRNADEVGRRAGDPDSTPPVGVPVRLVPTEDQSNADFRATCLPILDSPEYWLHNIRILPDLIRRSLEAIAASEPGILVHCGAGRDRTGMVSALLLANAGVPADDIFADYTASVRAMAGPGPQAHPTSDRQASWTAAEVDAWLGEVGPFVRAFANSIETSLSQLHIDGATRAQLRSLLTRP
jgi:protein-tyrosine phosphatase